MRVCHFEEAVESLSPLTLTRPAFDLRCGMRTLAEKQRRLLGADDWALWVRPHLAEVTRLEYPCRTVNDLAWLAAGPTVWVNGRWLPTQASAVPTHVPQLGICDGEIAWAFVAPEHLAGLAETGIEPLLEEWSRTLLTQPTAGTMLRYPWELVERNGDEIVADAHGATDLPAGPVDHLTIVGPTNRVHVAPTARIDPFVVFDTTQGPVVVGERVVVTAFTRIEGPCVLGPGTQVMGAKLRGGVTIGPQCRIGGEVETSIVHGHANKYHEGFLGHSYLGEWVNLGAGTHSSDLRNDYGPVGMIQDGRRIATGRSKVGCFVGDHSKTGLGTLLNTGTNIGVFCNLLPAGRLAGKYLPSFTNWWHGSLDVGTPIESLLETARIVMARRGRSLTPAHIRLYETIFTATEAERSRALRDREQRMLRRSA
jgi:UDP-N-acetylglucosamine diphosphorylase / glucose-1-phosphate thymidylyltransferase / UDP-N-acetylgalactosamine diphosphorylase / glucosamine-1-phosphate N-acetyltransferase / galactosamine-1-phosphate N-acetyltransferase